MKVDKFIYSWLRDLVILFAIISLMDLIIPKGSIKKHINLVIGLLIIYMVVNPLINIGNLNFDLDKAILRNLDSNIYSNDETQNHEEILEKHQMEIERIYKEKIEKEINEIINQDGKYNIYDMDIKMDNSEEYGYISEITIILNKDLEKSDRDIKIDLINSNKTSSETENDGNNFTNLKNMIAERLELDIKKINIYGK